MGAQSLVVTRSIPAGANTRLSIWLWALLAAYVAARVAQAFPDRIPMPLIVALHVLPPLVFAFLHGWAVYTLRGVFTFVLSCFVIGNLVENIGIQTGFPFGHYHFTDVMGPKLLQVPVLLGLAYVGMGYLSWTLARLILGDASAPLAGSRVVTRPLAAAFVMVAWDLSMDPIWSNLVHGWAWHQGGAYFGVPVTNFFGWYFTVYLIYQLFALHLWRTRAKPCPIPLRDWLVVVLFYGASAIGNLFVVAPASSSVITDAGGVPWRVGSILNASMLISIFVMGAFCFLGCVRVFDANHRPDSSEKLVGGAAEHERDRAAS